MFEQIIFLVILIFSIILHEIAHGYAALSLGDETAKDAGRLTLNPIPHIDMVGSIILPGILLLIGSQILFGWAKPVPYNPYNLRGGRYGEVFVAAAGSLLNIFLAVFFGLCIRFGGLIFSPDMLAIFELVVYVNLFLGLLNLLPIPPLDGSKVFSVFIPSVIRSWFNRKVRPIYENTNQLVLLLAVFIILIFLISPFAKFVQYLHFLITGSPYLHLLITGSSFF